MKRHAYPDYRSHKDQHNLFFRNLAELQHDLEENGVSSSLFLRINLKLVTWLIDHIMKTDKKTRKLHKIIMNTGLNMPGTATVLPETGNE